MAKQYKKILGVCLLAVMAIFFTAPIFAQTLNSSLAQQQDEQAQLQKQLDLIQQQITQYEQQLNTIQGEKNTLNNKIKQLKVQQAAFTLQIQQTQLNIQNITNQLNQTQDSITQSQQKLSQLKTSLADVIVALNDQDQGTLVKALLSGTTFSDFFDQVNAYQQLNSQLAVLAGQVQSRISVLQAQQNQLSDQQDQQQNLIKIQTLQSAQLTQSISDQNTLLQATKGQESSYQSMLDNSRAQAAAIRNRLYDLLGVSQQVTFGQAVDIAKQVAADTGVRAAFLLAILTQESNLGKNVGTCNRPGDPPEKSWRVVMKPDRDQQPFLQITADLGRNPDITPVSCPMHDSKGRQIGWGGAMGPAQFIPSTWMGYKDKITALTGKPADPWDIRDAFLAAGIKLAADGATSQDGEWAAAMRYFSGSTNPRYRFYGDSVVATANKYQQDIDQLNQ